MLSISSYLLLQPKYTQVINWAENTIHFSIMLLLIKTVVLDAFSVQMFV